MAQPSALAVRPDLFGERFDDIGDISDYMEALCWLDGLITAVAVGPQGVPTAEWVPFIWDRLDFSADTEWMKGPLERFHIRIYSDTMNVIRRAPVLFVPKFEGLDDEVSGAGVWAEGFRTAMALRPAAWKLLAADADHRHLLAPIMLLSLDDSQLRDILRPEAPRRAIDLAKLRQECADEIVEAVAGIYRYWQGRRGVPVHAVGRNAPCPCGSGRKYKKCCLR